MPDPTTDARVFAYGCGTPRAGLHDIAAEHALIRAMWDALVHADNRAERAQLDLAKADPALGPLIARIDALSVQITEAVKARRAARQQARSKVDTPDLDATIAALADERQGVRKDLYPLLKLWRKAHKPELKAIEQQYRDEAKAIRQGSGLYWGNYNKTAERFEAARKLAKQRGGRPRFSDPTRRAGVLSVQIQRTASGLGASMAEVLAGAFSGVAIDPVPADLDQYPRAERRQAARSTLRFRVNAAGELAELPVHIHRLPPPDWRIKAAQLTWKPEGEQLVWQLALTVVGPAVAPAHASPRACGIDVGWRRMPDGGLLVATAVGTAEGLPAPLIDPAHRLILPSAWMGAMDQCERLQEHVDDETLVLAQTWHAHVADLPDDLRLPLMGWRPKLGARHVDCAALHAAVQARIAAVRGTAARADVPESIRHWYDRYRHLLVWRDNLRAKLLRQRREHYRLWARTIAARYAVIGIEDIDLADLARTKTRAPEAGDNALHAAARAQRQRAACHALLLELKHQATKAGAAVVVVEAKHTTMQCHTCGEIVQARDRSARIWQCSNHHVFDQDINAAENIRDAAIGASAAVVSAPPEQKSRRWDAVRAALAERSQSALAGAPPVGQNE